MYKVESKQGNKTVEIEQIDNGIVATLDGKSITLDITKISEKEIHVLNQNKGYSVEMVNFDQDKKEITLKINGVSYHYKIKDQYDLLLKELGLNNQSNQKVSTIKAPMPGLVLDIMVEENQPIKKGDALLILEAMKMENVIKSPGDGEVKHIAVKKGKAVEKNELMIQLK